MKRITFRIAVLTIALLVVCQLSPAAFASGGINFGAEVVPGETETVVTIGGSNDAAFAELAAEGRYFKFSVPCTYSQTYAVYDGALVDSALVEGEATFAVAKSGEYKLVNGTAPVVTSGESQITVAVSEQNDAYLDTIIVDCAYANVRVTLNGTAISATASGGKVMIPVSGSGTYVIAKESASSGGSGSSSIVAGGTNSGTVSGVSSTNKSASYDTPITVPISGDEKTVRVEANVKGSMATIRSVDDKQLHNIIGSHVDTGTVTLDFSGLNRNIDTVVVPAGVIRQIADAAQDKGNDTEAMEIKLSHGTSIVFRADSLAEKAAQAKGKDICISIQPSYKVSALTREQKQTVGTRNAYDITMVSGGVHISDLGGEILVRVPYTLKPGEKAEGLRVYYVDNQGNREACETFYVPEKKQITWKTNHLSLYVIDYEAPVDETTEATEIMATEEIMPKTESDSNPTVTVDEEAPVQKNNNWLLYLCIGCLLLAAILGGYLLILLRKKGEYEK